MKPLQEEGGKEDAVVLQGGADLPHVSEGLGRFPPTQQLHSQEQLHSLEVCELMAGQQGFLQLVVGIDGVRSHYQMHNILILIVEEICINCHTIYNFYSLIAKICQKKSFIAFTGPITMASHKNACYYIYVKRQEFYFSSNYITSIFSLPKYQKQKQ